MRSNSHSYAPFGENYVPSGTQDLSFTGQNQDTESSGSGGAGGLYDFVYREHTPVQGRWLSPDPSGLAAVDPADPQSWNRYAYVGNRPLNSTDPLGLDCTLVGADGYLLGDEEICAYLPDDDDGGGGWGPIEIAGVGGGGGGGGFSPGDEAPGTASVLNTSPFGLDDLLGLLPGLGCGVSPSIGFTSGNPPISGPPCAATPSPDQTPILAAFETKVKDFKCTQAPDSDLPTGGFCKYICSSQEGNGQPSKTGAGATVPWKDILAKCGPRAACPIDVGIRMRLFCVIDDYCLGLGGKGALKWCAP